MHPTCSFRCILTCIFIALSNLCIYLLSVPRSLLCHRTPGTCFIKPGPLFIVSSATQYKMWWLGTVKNFENTVPYLNGESLKMCDCEQKI